MRCVTDLQAQDWPAFEIVVVDNAGDADLARELSDFGSGVRHPVSYVVENEPGVHRARHAGVAASSGELLLFTDDDATFAQDWVRSYAVSFTENRDMAAAGGPVRPVWQVDPPSWLLNLVQEQKVFYPLSLMEPHDEFRLEERGFFFSVNMAIRRESLFQTEGFHPEATGDVWLGDGETGLYREMWQKNMLIGYVPAAVVYHHIPRKRITVAYLRERMAKEGAAEVYSRFHSNLPNRTRLMVYGVSLAIRCFPYWVGDLIVRGSTKRKALALQFLSTQSWSEFRHVLRLIWDREYRVLVLKKNWLRPEA